MKKGTVYKAFVFLFIKAYSASDIIVKSITDENESLLLSLFSINSISSYSNILAAY